MHLALPMCWLGGARTRDVRRRTQRRVPRATMLGHAPARPGNGTCRARTSATSDAARAFRLTHRFAHGSHAAFAPRASHVRAPSAAAVGPSRTKAAPASVALGRRAPTGEHLSVSRLRSRFAQNRARRDHAHRAAAGGARLGPRRHGLASKRRLEDQGWCLRRGPRVRVGWGRVGWGASGGGAPRWSWAQPRAGSTHASLLPTDSVRVPRS